MMKACIMLSVKINLMTENETPERGGMDRISKSLQDLLDIYDRPIGAMVLKLTGRNFPKSATQKAGVWSFLLQTETLGCMKIFKGLKCRATLVTKNTFNLLSSSFCVFERAAV